MSSNNDRQVMMDEATLQLMLQQKILVVDDDPSILAAFNKLLAKKSSLVFCAKNTEEAQLLVKQHSDLALAIVDFALPHGNSLSFLEWLARTRPATVRIVISGFIDLEKIMPEIESGLVHRFFAKPWDNSLLMAQIQECLQQHLQLEQATTDPITQIGNHRSFQAQIRIEIERADRHKRPFSVAMIDVDAFKKLNDEIGHPKANNLLFQIAQAIKNSLRTIDHVYRFGGDEFAVLLPDTKPTDAFDVLERLRNKVQQLKPPGLSVDITISIGVAHYPEHGISTDDLVMKADHALYEAKHRGRNQTVIAPS